MDLTPRMLREFVNKLPEERLDDNISVYDPEEDEYFDILTAGITSTEKPAEESEEQDRIAVIGEQQLFLIMKK